MDKKTVFNIKIDFEKSHGAYLFDKKTKKEFLDFFGMFSSLALGYNHEIFDDSFNKKIAAISKVRMSNNLFQSDELIEFKQKFRKYIFAEHVHFTCTGALAVESAIKCALEYKKAIEPMVLGLKRSFHGINSWGFITDRYLGVTERVKYYPQNNWRNFHIDNVKKYIKNNNTKNIAAVVVEPIQCTSGDIYIDPKQLLELQYLCNENDICFIVDEIQTGFGVSGKMWYYEKLGLDPDVLVFGKKSQICGIVAKEKYSNCIVSPLRKLEVTFDGELMDAVRASYILKAYEKYDLVNKANANSERFAAILGDRVLNYRSTGNLIAFDFKTGEKRDEFVRKCFDRRLLCNPTAERTIRLRPHLAVTSDEIKHFAKIINDVI